MKQIFVSICIVSLLFGCSMLGFNKTPLWRVTIPEGKCIDDPRHSGTKPIKICGISEKTLHVGEAIYKNTTSLYVDAEKIAKAFEAQGATVEKIK